MKNPRLTSRAGVDKDSHVKGLWSRASECAAVKRQATGNPEIRRAWSLQEEIR